MQRTLIWDLPTRLFHWTLALSFAGAWLTSESDQWLSVHVFLGYLMAGLVGFRVIWGLVGTHYARFAAFWFSPQDALVYLRQVLAGRAERHIGHNPTGSVAIYFLLLLTLVVGVTGFVTLGAEEQQGLALSWMGIAQSRTFKKLHEFAAIAMLLLVIGHVAGVVVESLLHKENLARSMITGTKQANRTAPAASPRTGVALCMLVAMLTYGGWWFFYALHAPLEQQLGRSNGSFDTPNVAFVGAKLADNAQWRDECGSCHIAFHPSLLPSRSWRRIMREQAQHFGADLGLDAPTSAAILTFMSTNSADQKQTEAAFKIGRSIPPDSVPMRISDTPYFSKKHHNITDAQWKQPTVKSKANCGVCHLDAETGTFEDSAMHMPKGEPAAKTKP